jgi:Ca2+-binding EF-hand superfamily protein
MSEFEGATAPPPELEPTAPVFCCAAAVEHEECAICCDPLPAEPVGMLLCEPLPRKPTAPSCRHFFHVSCIKELRPPLRCPVCRVPFHSIGEIPPLTFAAGETWFAYFDRDGDGKLTYDEILDGLRAQVSLDWSRIDVEMDTLWTKWDPNRDHSISREEFLRPDDGLLAYLMKNFGQTPRAPPPELRRGRRAWFNYWDEDHSGCLSKDEVARALVKTFKIYDVRPATVLECVENIWPLFDLDGSGSIDIEEFCTEDNLADTILAQILSEQGDDHAIEEEVLEGHAGGNVDADMQ